MTINRTRLTLSMIFALSIISFIFLSPVQAKSQKPTEVEENQGQNNAELYKSTVAKYVQSLLDIADREKGIGETVRLIAKEQNDLKEKSVDAIDKIERRSKIKTFLIGTDYKNLGSLRSEMVKVRNNIEQLKRLVEKAKDKDNITELNAQIKILEDEQTKINDFIRTNESKFSLFGWVAKLLNK